MQTDNVGKPVLVRGGRRFGKTEALRQHICSQYAEGTIDFHDAHTLLTGMYQLTPRMALAYLAGAKAHVSANELASTPRGLL